MTVLHSVDFNKTDKQPERRQVIARPSKESYHPTTLCTNIQNMIVDAPKNDLNVSSLILSYVCSRQFIFSPTFTSDYASPYSEADVT